MILRPAAIAAVAALLTVPAAAPADAAPREERRPVSSVVLDWEHTAMLTIYGPFTAPAPKTPIPEGVLYLGFVSLAMHDAVETSAAMSRSSEAAAAAQAAHDVLRAYYASSAPELDAALESSLAQVPDGQGEDTGIEVGKAAADETIASRVGDGRGNPTIHYSKPKQAGYWQPVAPATDMLVPWLGSVDYLVLSSPVRVNGPDRLTSDAYADDYDEVFELGSVDSTERTAAQTRTAQFFNSNSAVMVGEALINLLEDDPTGIRRTARIFAMMHAAMADSIIRCWELKRDVGFWRPFQAIAGWDTDDNPDTGPWPTTWVPLLANPPYADYVSGHGALTAPAVQTIRMTLGEDTRLRLHSYATGADRSSHDLSTIERQAFHARIWGGLHFRDAMGDAYSLGHETARRVRHALLNP